MKVQGAFTYILTNEHHTVLYVGATVDLFRRMIEHKEKYRPNAFSAKYNCFKLVYFEGFNSVDEAFAREKQIKAGSRKKKIALIVGINPEWKDLFEVVKTW
jgi:putative endonuclease